MLAVGDHTRRAVPASSYARTSNLKTMRRLAASLAVVAGISSPLSAQERDPSLARISLAIQQTPPRAATADPHDWLRTSTLQMLGISLFEPLPGAPKLGPFTLGTPQLQGEMIRVSVPVGAYVMRAVRGISAANHRRKEAAARRRVEAELKALVERPPPQ
jgi:hypothetical protein